MEGSVDSLIVDSGKNDFENKFVDNISVFFVDGTKKGKPWTLRKLVGCISKQEEKLDNFFLVWEREEAEGWVFRRSWWGAGSDQTLRVPGGQNIIFTGDITDRFSGQPASETGSILLVWFCGVYEGWEKWEKKVISQGRNWTQPFIIYEVL